MPYIYIWLIVAALMYAIWTYATGRSEPPQDKGDLGGMFFFGLVLSLFWPICLALLIVFGPFVGLHELGKRHRKTAEHKKKMWDTLKK
jgi:uncharacterized membrane protein